MIRFLQLTIFFSLVSCDFADGDDKMNLVIQSANGDIEKVEEYAEKVNELNFVSLKGETPLNAASYNGHIEVVKFLIASGADCNYKDSSGKSAYEVARQQDQPEVQSYLQSLGKCTN